MDEAKGQDVAKTLLTAGLLLAAALGATCQAAEGLMSLEAKISLGDVAGRIDHLAIDIKRHRLFVAELGNNSVGVVDVAAQRLLKRIAGFNEPQGVAQEPAADRIYVANAGDGVVKILTADNLSPVGEVDLGDDADNIRVAGPDRVMVGYGNGAIAVLEAGKRVTVLPLTGHPESFQLDSDGGRLFVNEPEAHRVAVLDGKTGKELGKWNVPGLGANFPMAFDGAGHRLFVVYRSRPTLAIFGTAKGELLAQVPTCGDADDVFFDGKRNRVYISCGDGFLAIVNASDDGFAEVGKIPTRKGARTSLFVRELDRLFVAVRAEGGQPAEIWVYRPQ
jgi:DNA-binding beta-propeller fold protein YncE